MTVVFEEAHKRAMRAFLCAFLVFVSVNAQGPPLPLPPALPVMPTGRVTLEWEYPAAEVTSDLVFLLYHWTEVGASLDDRVVLRSRGALEGWTNWIHSGAVSYSTNGLSFGAGQGATGGMTSVETAVEPGREYRLSFDAGVLAFNQQTQRLQVLVSGSNLLTTVDQTLVGDGTGVVRWKRVGPVSFVPPTRSLTVLALDLSEVTDSIDLLMNNVELVEVGAARHVRTVAGTNLTTTVVVAPGVNYFAIRASNFWGVSSFSDVALTPPLPRGDVKLGIKRAD